jgi:hypothetical protein
MNVDLARIQFAFTAVNHFFFVPVTIGLGPRAVPPQPTGPPQEGRPAAAPQATRPPS